MRIKKIGNGNVGVVGALFVPTSRKSFETWGIPFGSYPPLVKTLEEAALRKWYSGLTACQSFSFSCKKRFNQSLIV